MTLANKVAFLTIILIGFIAYSVVSFDYGSIDSENLTVKEESEKIQPINMEFEIVKSNNIVVISGLFRDEVQAEELSNYLNINKTDFKRYDKAVVYSKKNIDEIKNFISPLKDYYINGAKIVLKNQNITIDGELKDEKYRPLIEAIVNKSNLNITTNFIYVEPEIETQTVQEEEYSNIQEEINALLKEEKIRFKTNSTKIANESLAVIGKVAELIKNSPQNLFIEVAGHTDAKGKKSTNKWISKQRAKSVMNELIKNEVSAQMLEAKGYGESQPIVLNDPEGYSKINRRVEIVVFDLEKIEEDKILLQEKIDNLIRKQKINFQRRSTSVTPESLDVIGKIAELINESENLLIEVGGHTDAKGAESLNKRISKQRARSVMNELIKLDVDKSKLTAVGYGEEQPIAQNDENGLSEINRRVEFIVRGVK